ncbi:MAG: TolC family protein, partial [Dissulfurimicrobium sp.]
VVALLAGCTPYHPMPIDSLAVKRALAPVDTAKVKIELQGLENPLLRPLKPVPFDLSDGLSIDEAAIMAVVANPGLKAERDRLGLARAQVLKAGILPNPKISAGLDRPTGGPTKGTVNAYNAQIEWDITSLISRAAELEAQKKDLRSVELEVAWKEWQVAEAARLSFIHLFWAQRRFALLKGIEKDMKKRLDILKKAAVQGNETALNLDAAEAAFSQFELGLSKSEEEVKKDRLALNMVLGLPPDYEIHIQDVGLSAWPGKLPSEDSVLNGLEARRLDLVALKEGYEGEEARLRADILKQFPKMALGIVRSRDTGAIVTTGFAVSIDLPVFDRNQGGIAVEHATRQRLFDEYMARLFEARSQLASITSDINAVRDQVGLLQQAVENKRRLLKQTEAAFKRGDIDAIGYYQVVEDLINKELEFLNLKESFTELAVALEAASGLYFPYLHTAQSLPHGGGGR